MATQFKHTDFANTPTIAAQPNVRVAFIAGEATTAVHDAMAKLPADTRDGTLDDLVWDQGVAAAEDVTLIQSMTCALIEKAQELLSPRMYSAFLRWGEAASYLSTIFETDAEGDLRCQRNAAAGRVLGEVSAEHVHDVIIKMLVVGIETADCSAFGPFADVRSNDQFGCEQTLLRGLSADLDWVSPLPALFNELSCRAWQLSISSSAFSLPIGSAITSTFSFARGLDSAEQRPPAGSSQMPASYDRFMGGPFISWQRAYSRYEEAHHALYAYDRDIYSSTFATPNVAESVKDSVQEQFDVLLMAEHDAVQWLYRIPAPSASELAIKLKIFVDMDGYDLTYAPEAMRQIAIDARRFGRHGAHLQTDEAILDAFAGRRRAFYETETIDLSGEAEDAYFQLIEGQDGTLFKSQATTLEGVLAKLRVGFSGADAMAWSDHALGDTNRPEFREGLRMTGFSERLIWGAIEDLARIAGVSLAEQGA